MQSTEETFGVPGLDEPVEILVDRWGVPHIYAATRHDVFVAQGFNAARDRLFQLDLWRRRGLGLMAEVFGPEHVERDRAARLFLYRGDMHAEWLAYGSETKQVVTAFVRGVNAFIRCCAHRPDLLPPEFTTLGYRPSLWESSDVARIRSHGLIHNVEQEVARALTLRDYGTDVEDLRQTREPARALRVPDGLDLEAIPDDVLHVYRLATSPADLGGDPAHSAPRTDPEGSNNWVLGPERTTTGRPILANDPHRAVGLPSLRYIAHLVAPGLDVIGAGEPALPGISIGHNGHIAFGLTIFSIDQEDLYCYRTNPGNPDEYWYDGRWEPMTSRTETVPVAGTDGAQVRLQWTRHGPVIHRDNTRNTAFALRTVWLEPGTAPYLGSMDYMGARDADQFVTAMNRWCAPGENQVYADPAGTIGWRPTGLVPRRPNWDGTLPVPGDGRYEWDGFHDVDDLPAERNPRRGWIATANEMNLPDDHPHDERTVSFDWADRQRKDRIDEVIGASGRMSVEDCVRLQCDYVDVAARRIVRVLEEVTGTEAVSGDPVGADPDAALGLDVLRGWDGDETPSSPQAALYGVWHRRHLRPQLFRTALAARLTAEDVPRALRRVFPKEAISGDMRADLAMVTRPERLLGRDGDDDAAAVLADVLLRSLAEAVRETRRLLGQDPARWSWGRLHHALLTHPAARLFPGVPPWASIGPAPRGGSGNTVGNTNVGPNFRQTSGATFRMVIDVGDWDESVAMNSPGQSGDPRNPHYDDLFGPWAADQSFPLLYRRETVEQHIEHRLILSPANTGSTQSG